MQKMRPDVGFVMLDVWVGEIEARMGLYVFTR